MGRSLLRSTKMVHGSLLWVKLPTVPPLPRYQPEHETYCEQDMDLGRHSSSLSTATGVEKSGAVAPAAMVKQPVVPIKQKRSQQQKERQHHPPRGKLLPQQPNAAAEQFQGAGPYGGIGEQRHWPPNSVSQMSNVAHSRHILPHFWSRTSTFVALGPKKSRYRQKHSPASVDLKWVSLGHRGCRSWSSVELMRSTLAQDHFDRATDKEVKTSGENKQLRASRSVWKPTRAKCRCLPRHSPVKDRERRYEGVFRQVQTENTEGGDIVPTRKRPEYHAALSQQPSLQKYI